MITILDDDLPISVADKIITGKRPSNATHCAKAIAEALTGEKCETMDMFSLEEMEIMCNALVRFTKTDRKERLHLV